MDEINIDFDIHTRCQDFMMTNDFRGNNVVYKFALDSFTKLNKLIIYLASKYRLWCFIVNVHHNFWVVKILSKTPKSLKSQELVDASELIYQLWTEVCAILAQKAQRVELINDMVFNATSTPQLISLR